MTPDRKATLQMLNAAFHAASGDPEKQMHLNHLIMHETFEADLDDLPEAEKAARREAYSRIYHDLTEKHDLMEKLRQDVHRAWEQAAWEHADKVLKGKMED